MKEVVILGIDNFSYKNIYQVKCLNYRNYKVSVFTNDVLKNSSKNLNNKNDLYILEKSLLRRIIQIYRFLYQNKKNINHVEIYPGGRFSFIYLVIAKILNIKSIIVERGDICFYHLMNKFTKFSMRFCYKFSNIVWYRESYKDLDVEKQLKAWDTKKTYFIPNAAPEINIVKQNNLNKYLFLWANRFLEERKVAWFVDSINELKTSKSVMLGLMNIYDEEKYALNNKSKYLEVLEYQDPKEYYLKSKFFVLPSDVVFLNNALLESMSYGVVPLISDVQDARLIVDDGINGFIFEHTEEGLKNAMQRAISLSEEEYEIMSKNVINKVKESFSYDVWCEKYMNMIKSLDNV